MEYPVFFISVCVIITIADRQCLEISQKRWDAGITAAIMPISMEQKEFNCVLRENLRQAVTPDDTVCYIKTGRVQKAAARALKKLRRQYKQLVLHGEKMSLIHCCWNIII